MLGGYIIAVAAVVAISGGWTEQFIDHYLKIDIPWQLLSAVLSLGALALIISRAKPSTGIAAMFFAFELVLLLVIAIALLIQHSGSINLKPLDPGNLHDGFSGLSLGFPLAVFLFVGWENSAAMAEESADPRAGVGRAIFSSVALVAVLYVVLSYATVVGFDDNAAKLIAADVPMVDAARGVASFLTAHSRTPYVALIVYMALALGLTDVFGWNTDPSRSSARSRRSARS